MESIVPAPQSSETPSQPPASAPQTAAAAPKKPRSAPKKKGTAPKNEGTAPKNEGSALKYEGTPQKYEGTAPKNAALDPDDVFLAAESADATPDDAPRVKRVALAAPTRTGRTVDDLAVVLDRAEVRLRLAWRHRGVLDAALPQRPPFHDHAWTAVALLRAEAPEADAGDGSGGAAAALGALLESLTVLRNAVEFTTRAGDPAREALLFGTTLRATGALVDVAPQVIAGARAVQARFPALTDEVITDADEALEGARAKVKGTRRDKVDEAVARIDGADARQLALDVLLDCVDHLRAAARTRLHKTRPRLCEALCAPIERAKPRAPSGGEVDDAEKDGEQKDDNG